MAFINRDNAGKKKSYSEMAVSVFLELLKTGSKFRLLRTTSKKHQLKFAQNDSVHCCTNAGLFVSQKS